MKEKWKKISILGLVLLLAGSLMAGCKAPAVQEAAAEEPNSQSQSEEEKKTTEKTDGTAAEEQEKENASGETEAQVPDGLETMLLPMDALMVCMYENGYAYTSEKTVFWTALSDMLGFYGEQHPLSSMDGGRILIPRQAVQEYAAALFLDYDDLPEIPEFLEEQVSYDEAWDAYRVKPKERSFSPLQITGWEAKDENLEVEVTLYQKDTQTPLCVGKFQLSPNPYADGITDPMFFYSVSSMELGMPESQGAVYTLEGTFQGLADGHTAEILTKEEPEAFQFQDEQVAEYLSGLKAGDPLVFRAEYNHLGQGTILEID